MAARIRNIDACVFDAYGTLFDVSAAAVSHAGIDNHLDAVLSIEEVGIYKPHASVYQLAVDRLGVEADRIAFMSANAWDASEAGTFGLHGV